MKERIKYLSQTYIVAKSMVIAYLFFFDRFIIFFMLKQQAQLELLVVIHQRLGLEESCERYVHALPPSHRLCDDILFANIYRCVNTLTLKYVLIYFQYQFLPLHLDCLLVYESNPWKPRRLLRF